MYKIFLTYKCLNCGAVINEAHNYDEQPIDDAMLENAAFVRKITALDKVHACDKDTKGIALLVSVSRNG